MLSKLSQIVNRLYAFIYEINHSKSGLGLPSIVALDVARSHDGDGGGEDRPPPHHVPSGCMGKGKRKPNLGGRAAGRLNTREKTRNLSLKEITDTKGPIPIHFELRDKQTVMPLGDHAAHWSSYIGEVIRGAPLYSPSWLKVPKEQKATLITDIGAAHGILRLDRDQRRHPATLAKGKIWRERPENIKAIEWDKYIEFWNDPRNIARAAQNRQNRAKSTVISRQGSRLLARFRYEMEKMRRLEALGTYTDDEINRLARGGKQRGHIAGV
nr:hypothetical protein [Tanacetum cinerariifolium]